MSACRRGGSIFILKTAFKNINQAQQNVNLGFSLKRCKAVGPCRWWRGLMRSPGAAVVPGPVGSRVGTLWTGSPGWMQDPHKWASWSKWRIPINGFPRADAWACPAIRNKCQILMGYIFIDVAVIRTQSVAQVLALWHGLWGHAWGFSWSKKNSLCGNGRGCFCLLFRKSGQYAAADQDHLVGKLLTAGRWITHCGLWRDRTP